MVDSGTAFVLICAALALVMTPALAFFYGGLVRASSAISMMMLSFGALGVVAVLWIAYGYAVVFANAGTPGYFGVDGVLGIDSGLLGLDSLVADVSSGGGGDALAGAALQAMYAVVAVALVSGAVADRARFGAWLLFAGAWASLVYFPIAGWVFNVRWGAEGLADGGWISYGLDSLVGAGALDFAGGTAIHINAGAAALALALVLGKRINFGQGMQRPHSIPLVLFGAAMLWFGWFGFNAGAEGAADPEAALVVVNTIVCPSAALLAWLIVETIRGGKATAVGAACGVVSGLVAITPGCAYLTPVWALILGAAAGTVCALAVDLKYVFGFDDSLDVIGIHLVGGLLGTIYLGFFAEGEGLVYSGRFDQLFAQLIGAFSVLIYSFVMTLVIGWLIDRFVGFRVHDEVQRAGIDRSVHGESALHREAS